MVDLPEPEITVVQLRPSSSNASAVASAFADAMANREKLSEEVFQVHGFSGRKIRLLLNNVVAALPSAKYMEIGVFAGASFLAAIIGNKVQAMGIDNWSWAGSNRAYFYRKLSELSSDDSSISIFEREFRDVNWAAVGEYNILFYDGNHGERDQYDAVLLPQAALASEYILAIDDWNWEKVRRGTLDGLRDVGAEINYAVEIRTTLDGELTKHGGMNSDWHNGFFMAAVSKASG